MRSQKKLPHSYFPFINRVVNLELTEQAVWVGFHYRLSWLGGQSLLTSEGLEKKWTPACEKQQGETRRKLFCVPVNIQTTFIKLINVLFSLIGCAVFWKTSNTRIETHINVSELKVHSLQRADWGLKCRLCFRFAVLIHGSGIM